MRSISGRVSWSSFGWSLRLVGKHLSLGLSRLIQQNIICVENEFGVVREWHLCQPVHEHDEEQGTEYTEPWGTPEVTWQGADVNPLMTVRCCLFER